jgi:hypothetical protein
MQAPSPIRSLLLCIVLLQQLAAFGVRADILLQLVVYSSDDAPIQDAVDTTALALLDSLISVEPDGFVPVDPGGEIPTRRRGLRNLLLRNLQVNYCPPTCAHKTSAKCRALGCAFCGSTCEGRLRMLLDGGELAAVQADMNDALAPFCDGGAASCDIGAQILYVDEFGNTTELV